MVSTQVQSAVYSLQLGASATGDAYQLELTDRALDELLRKAECQRPAAFQIRSARANAAKVVQSRRAVFARHVLRNRDRRPGVLRQDRLAHTSSEGFIDTMDWLARTPSLTEGQRRLLMDLADGHDAHSLSHRDQVPLDRIQERISRARRVGWEAYQHEMATS